MINEYDVIVVGAGVAGLVAAKHCEDAGLNVLLLEKNNTVGGKIQTTEKNGYLLDHGFQVLLTSYPEAKKHLDYEALDLQQFWPGARIYYDEAPFEIVDPFRIKGHTTKTAMAPIGSWSDKFKIAELALELKRKDTHSLFDHHESTVAYLKELNFSDEILKRFFKPFFGGIFLDNNLQTSANMFRFVFKMFADGYAAVPARGMGEIPKQLASKLKQTEIRLNAGIKKASSGEVVMENGEVIKGNQIIVATHPDKILKELRPSSTPPRYRKTTNLYFTAREAPYKHPVISLNGNGQGLVNNFCVLTNVCKGYAPDGKVLISVSLNDVTSGSDQELSHRVLWELQSMFGLETAEWQLLHRFDIPEALPVFDYITYEPTPESIQVAEDVYLAGDHMANPSLNAAILSGRKAAELVIEKRKVLS